MKFPIFIENSKVPVILSAITPIDIWAISFGVWVWCRGKMNEETRRHEAIHFWQQVELLFVFQWILYGLFWLIGRIRFKDGVLAYYQNPFEIEAYENDKDVDYLDNRGWYSWRKYV